MACPAGQRPHRSPRCRRAEVARRLGLHRPEIEEAILTRLNAVSDLDGADAEYLEGLRAAVGVAVDAALLAIEREEEAVGPLPPAMLAQARQAARKGIRLDIVLRRYFAGYTALGDFFLREIRDEPSALDQATLYRAQKELAALFDRIVVAVTAEYEDESAHIRRSRVDRMGERIRRLLAGELVEAVDLEYDLEAWHVAAIAEGDEQEKALRGLERLLDCRVLLVSAGLQTIWAWLGSRRKIEAGDVARLCAETTGAGSFLALGEPARGIAGWRLTHRQARAVEAIARRRPQSPVSYRRAALLATIVRDGDLAEFLTNTYLRSLGGKRDDGTTMRETLQAYFSSGLNISSAAAALAVSRKTVDNRLRKVEQRLGCPISSCAVELELALRLEDLGVGVPNPPSSTRA